MSGTEVVAGSEEVPAAEVEARAGEGAAVVDDIKEETVVVCNEALVEAKLIVDCTVCSVDEACAVCFVDEACNEVLVEAKLIDDRTVCSVDEAGAAVASELVIGGVEAGIEDDVTLCSVEGAAAVESPLVGGAVEAEDEGGCKLGKLEVAGPGVEAAADITAEVTGAAVLGGAG